MSMPSLPTKMQPWQVFHACRKHLGANTVARIFGREIRSAQSWAQDPLYTQHRCRSPLELLHTLFERMDAVGLGYAARAAIQYLQTALGDEPDPDEIILTLPTIQQEILADYSAVARLQQAIEDGLDVATVTTYYQDAKDELDRTLAKYLKDANR